MESVANDIENGKERFYSVLSDVNEIDLAAAFKSTADTLNDELKLSGPAVKNSDEAKNDEFLNGFNKAIRGNETSYDM